MIHPQQKKIYGFIGYPKNKTKPKYGTTFIEGKLFSYSGTIVSLNTYKQLSISPHSHIVIGFDPKRSLDEKGETYTFPEAKGMSGSGVWLLENLNNKSSNSDVNKLVGIGIEYHKEPKVMVGTRIRAVIEIIKRKFLE